MTREIPQKPTAGAFEGPNGNAAYEAAIEEAASSGDLAAAIEAIIIDPGFIFLGGGRMDEAGKRAAAEKIALRDAKLLRNSMDWSEYEAFSMEVDREIYEWLQARPLFEQAAGELDEAEKQSIIDDCWQELFSAERTAHVIIDEIL